MLPSAHYAQRRGLTRPFARGMARQRRMGQKLSIGLTPAQVARLEGMGTAEVEALLAEPGFAALAEGYRALHAMAEAEQRRILTSLARHLLMEAMAHGDVRVACFVLLQDRKGQDPARTLADGVIAAAQREPRPAPMPGPPGPSPRPAYPSDDPGLRSLRGVEARLRAELAQEHAAVHAAVAADESSAADLGSVAPGAEASDLDADASPGLAERAADAHSPVAPRLDRGGHLPHPEPMAARSLLSDDQRRALAHLRDQSPAPRARSP